MTWLLKSANDKVRFPNWLYHPSKLFLHHRYGPLKINMHPNCYVYYFFSSFLYKWYMYLLETANIMFLSFINFELLSFEHGYPISHKMWNTCIILWLFCWDTIKFSFTQRYSISFPFFPHILSISGKPHLFSWERLDSSIFVCTS